MRKQCGLCICVRWEEGGKQPSIIPNPHMSVLEIPTGPPISENKLTYRVHKWKAQRTDAPEHGSITYDHEKEGMEWEWADYNTFLDWLATKETMNSIEFIVSQVEHSDTPIWREWHVYRCAREYSGRKTTQEKITEWGRTIPSKKTGCWCCLTIKRYPHTDTILGKYEDQHDHTIGDDNLQFTRLLDATKALVMDMVCTGIDSKAIVCGNYIFPFLNLTAVQQKHVRESCMRSNRDYHIPTHDIMRLCRTVENTEIRYNENDAISIRVWIALIQQDGGSAILKDKLDPLPQESGLSSETFVLCIQTKFQRDQFQMLGSNFLSIDATHNTCQYKGLQFYTLVVRDHWGHGTLCGAFLLWVNYSISAP